MHNPKYIIFADNSLKEKRKTKYERRLQHTQQEQRQGVLKCLAPPLLPRLQWSGENREQTITIALCILSLIMSYFFGGHKYIHV